MLEQTFVIIKPNAVKKHVIGSILKEYENQGFQIIGLKMSHISKNLGEEFYQDHKDKPFFSSLIKFITSGPVVLLALQGTNAVLRNREIMGPTNPEQGNPDTLRRRYGDSIEANAVHGSDSVVSAEREISLFFSKDELFT